MDLLLAFTDGRDWVGRTAESELGEQSGMWTRLGVQCIREQREPNKGRMPSKGRSNVGPGSNRMLGEFLIQRNEATNPRDTANLLPEGLPVLDWLSPFCLRLCPLRIALVSGARSL